jgi:hypothetical protein
MLSLALLISIPFLQTVYSQGDTELSTQATNSTGSAANQGSAASIERSTYKNTNEPLIIDLKAENGNADKVYVLVDSPKNGEIENLVASNVIPDGMVRYILNKDYPTGDVIRGSDFFTYVTKDAVDSDSQSLQGIVTITVKVPSSALEVDKDLRIVLSFFIAIVIVITVTLAARRLIKKGSITESSGYKSRFSDILRGRDMDPSLSIFQFFLWTFVLMFVFISVYFIRIFGGVSDPPAGPLPIYLLAIAGISVATPIISTLITSAKYSTSNPVQFISDSDKKTAFDRTKAPISNQTMPIQRPGFSSMLKELGKPTLSRFQMFAWTWIGIAIYLAVFTSTVVEKSNTVYDLSIPDVDPVLVVLMGLSQFAFLGIKTAGSNEIQISMIYPSKVSVGGKFSIFGKDFGEEMQSIYIGSRKIAVDDNLIETWTSDRIDIRLPSDLAMGTYNVVVLKGGSAKKADETLQVISTVTQETNSHENTADSTIIVNDESITIQKDTEFSTSFRRINPNLDSTDVKFLITDQPSNGKVILNADGHSIVYIPKSGYVGVDSFTYKAKKGDTESKKGNIRITMA